MKSQQKISSTENLLETIRGNPRAEKTPGPASATAGQKTPRRGWAGGAGLAKGVTIGVEIAADALRVARMEIAGGAPRLAACQAFPYPAALNPDSDNFTQFLKASLNHFGVTAADRLWTTIYSDQSEVHQLIIPKATKKDLAEVVFWTMQKEKKFCDKRFIFDFRPLGEVMDKGIPKLRVICYLTPRKLVQARQRLFHQAGFSLTGITFDTAALNNLLRLSPPSLSFESLVHVHIDEEWSRIDLFHQRDFIFNRNIKTGSNSFAEAIVDHTAAAPPRPATEPGEAAGPLTPEAAAALLQAHLHATLASPAPGFSAAEVLTMITPAVERLINQTERTLEFYVRNLNLPRIEKLLLSGAAALFPGLAAYMQEQLALDVEVLDPFAALDLGGAGGLAPRSPVERVLFTVPLGLALSDSAHTPNALYTYKERAQTRRDRLINRVMAVAMLFLVVAALGVYGWQAGQRAEQRAELQRLQAELAAFAPELNAPHLQALFTDIKRNQDEIGKSLHRHQSLAVLGEVAAASAAPRIRLHSVLLDAPGPAAGSRGNLVLEGFVHGDPQMQDSYLAGYIMRLQSSGLLGNAKLQKSADEFYPAFGTVLRFTLSVQYS